MNVIVGNVRQLSALPADYTCIYVARNTSYRPQYGEDFSMLGNPYPLTGYTREISIQKYGEHLDRLGSAHPAQLSLQTLTRRAQAGEKLALLCFCDPLECHAGEVKRRIEAP